MNWNASAAFVGTVGFLVIAIFVAAAILRFAHARRHDPADVDVTPKQRTVSSSSGFTSIDGSGNVRVVRGKQ